MDMSVAATTASHAASPAQVATPPLTTTNPFPPWSKAAIASFVLVAPAPIGMWVLAASADLGPDVGGALGLASFVCIVVGFVVACVVRAQRKRQLPEDRLRGGGFVVAATWFGALYGILVAFTFIGGVFLRGRQVRRRGKALLPPVDANSTSWTPAPSAALVDDQVRRGVAAQWRENGRTEHASIAAFSRLSLDLLSLGAPKHLVDDAHNDALDESWHTEACFAQARRFDGEDAAPGAFKGAWAPRSLPPLRTLALARLAVDSLVDGALNEAVSARTLAGLARVVDDSDTRALLLGIAKDEAHHSAHAWNVLQWCVVEGGVVVAAAVDAAMNVLARPRVQHSGAAVPARTGEWERFGLAAEAREQAAHDVVIAQARARLAALLS